MTESINIFLKKSPSVDVIIGEPTVAPITFSACKSGAQGPKGDALKYIDLTLEQKSELKGIYTHDQILSSKSWVIDHNLGEYPSIVVLDSAGDVVIGEIKYDSFNRVTINFTASISGKAYLS